MASRLPQQVADVVMNRTKSLRGFEMQQRFWLAQPKNYGYYRSLGSSMTAVSPTAGIAQLGQSKKFHRSEKQVTAAGNPNVFGLRRRSFSLQ
jgi:hypothetical protein